MDASNIKDVFESLKHYSCILIDGKWGVGKTFEVNKAIECNENVLYVSLFGLNNSEELYKGILTTVISRRHLKGNKKS